LVTPKDLIEEFEQMRNMAELRALSKFSLENPVDDLTFKRMMELKQKCL